MPKESSGTSLNQISSGLKMIEKIMSIEPNHVNLDYGGGKYNKGTEYLKTRSIDNLVYDPFNRPKAHNEAIELYCDLNRVDSITILNVFNVIPSEIERYQILDNCLAWLKDGGKIIISIYEKNGDGIMERTSKGYQNNLKTERYQIEIDKTFGYMVRSTRKGNIIILEEK